MFQTVFQGFHLPTLGGRLVLALTGAGLALTAAVAFATFVKLMGLGVLSRSPKQPARIQLGYSASVRSIGAFRSGARRRHAVVASGSRSRGSAQFGVATTSQMHDGLLLFRSQQSSPSPRRPCSSSSCRSAVLPTMLVVARSRRAIRRTAVWYGGLSPDPALASTTALTFSNAMRNVLQFCLSPDSRHRARRRR